MWFRWEVVIPKFGFEETVLGKRGTNQESHGLLSFLHLHCLHVSGYLAPTRNPRFLFISTPPQKVFRGSFGAQNPRKKIEQNHPQISKVRPGNPRKPSQNLRKSLEKKIKKKIEKKKREKNKKKKQKNTTFSKSNTQRTSFSLQAAE